MVPDLAGRSACCKHFPASHSCRLCPTILIDAIVVLPVAVYEQPEAALGHGVQHTMAPSTPSQRQIPHRCARVSSIIGCQVASRAGFLFLWRLAGFSQDGAR